MPDMTLQRIDDLAAVSDQCVHCTLRGDASKCDVQPCSIHESWYAQRLRADNATLRQALKVHAEEAAKMYAEPVAWMVKAKHGLIRACWSEQPSDEQIAVAIADGDTIIPLFLRPQA